MASLEVTKTNLSSFFRTSSASLEPEQFLHQNVRELLGVNDGAFKALQMLGGIESVFDLATSNVFDAATKLTSAAQDPSSPIFRYGKIPKDLIRAPKVNANGSGRAGENRVEDSTTADEVGANDAGGVADKKDENLAVGNKQANPLVVDVPAQPIEWLTTVPQDKATEISKALDVKTIRELSIYPPYTASRRILDYVYFPGLAIEYDPERPTDLVPSSGEYPIEKVQYSTLLMDNVQTSDPKKLTDITSSEFKPLDLAKLDATNDGFQTVAAGALLTFTQSWFAQAVTLGHLLHSVTLAPGESTRIAVIDWSRRTDAGETEVITEADRLTSNTDHSRAISEVTNAVADEAQGGFSHSNTNSSTKSKAESESGNRMHSFGYATFGGPSDEGASSKSKSRSTATSDSYSTTWGSKDIASSMLQNVSDRTHQNASSSRNRRASVVKEVSQNEHEALSTRVIANYNHMHALSIQYYEVVQIFRVEVRLSKAVKVLFVPMAMPDFADVNVIRRFQLPLMQASLSSDIYQALSSMNTIELAPEPKSVFSVFDRSLSEILSQALQRRSSLMAGTASFTVAGHPRSRPMSREHTVSAGSRDSRPISREDTVSPGGPTSRPVAREDTGSHGATTSPRPDRPRAPGGTLASLMGLLPPSTSVTAGGLARGSLVRPSPVRFQDALPVISQANLHLWDKPKLSMLASLLRFPVLQPSSTSLYLPTDCIIEGAAVTGSQLPFKASFHTKLDKDVTDFGGTGNSLALRDIESINIQSPSVTTEDQNLTVNLSLSRNGVVFPLQLPSIRFPKGLLQITVVNVRSGAIDANIRDHLKANRMHYAHAIFRSLDSMQIAQLLAGYGYTLNGVPVPLSQIVEPTPIRYVGNYLVFKTNLDSTSDEGVDPKWDEFRKRQNIKVGEPRSDIVPLGSGGVFAEAVLGRSNCAEKLDQTRFWDWKDSPIPLQPSDIAALQAGSRAVGDDTKPGQLSAPIVTINSPGPIPDPTGTAPLLSALQSGTLFRDQSGLLATLASNQAALQATQAGAAAAGQQASQSLGNQLSATTERQRIAAAMITDLAKTAASFYTGGLFGGGSSKIGDGAKTGSQQGALINYFDKMQQGQDSVPPTRTSPDGAAPGSTVRGGTSPGGASSTGPRRDDGRIITADRRPTSSSDILGIRNPAAAAAVGGNTSFFDSIWNKIDGILGIGKDASGAGPLEARKAWPKLDAGAVLSRIQELKTNAYQFNQGGFGLCAAAAFFYIIIRTNANEFESFAKNLYGAGLSFLGEMEVDPDINLRNADYSAIMASLPASQRPGPPQAEWMLMCSLVDSQNFWYDYEGTWDEGYAMEVQAKRFKQWCERVGWYTNITHLETKPDGMSIEDFKSADGEEGTFTTLMIRASLLSPHFPLLRGVIAGHAIVLESAIDIDQEAKTAKFVYWTWATPPREIQTTLEDLQRNVYGIIKITKK